MLEFILPISVLVGVAGLLAWSAHRFDKSTQDRTKFVPRTDYDTLLDTHMWAAHDRKRLIEACETALQIIEQEVPPPEHSPGHICGHPDAMCDGNCMDAANFYAKLWKVKNALRDAKESRR